MKSKKLFGTNGIRGLANKDLTPDMVIRIGSSIGTFFKKKNILVGYDARTSGPMFAKAMISSLSATGCSVFFAGMAPTPALQYAVRNCEMDGGVIITASHNPPEYNGIKVIWNDGIEISQRQEEEIEDIYFNGRYAFAEWDKLGNIRELPGVIDSYIETIKKHINIQRIVKKHFHVVVDAANSVASLATPRLLRELGCKVTTINANIDGTFSGRLPEPRPENLGDLSSTVKAIKADLGVAFDGDADRSIFVDEKGSTHWGDKTFALILKYFLIDSSGEKVVTPVSSSTLIKEIAEAYRGELVWTKVGSVTVSHTMKETGAKLGGEENGGVFYGPHQAVRDGSMATTLVLDIMAKTGERLSNLIAEQPQYFIEKGKVDCLESQKEPLLKKLRKEIAGPRLSHIDGVKIWFEDDSSILIRPSGTEPTYRIYAEAKTQEKAQELVNTYSSKLKEMLPTV